MGEDEVEDEKKKESEFFGSTTVGSRGQIVIPCDLREELEIESGDKLLFFYFPHREKEFTVMKPGALHDMEEFAKRLKEKAEIGKNQEKSGN